jgi:hypothetical protein
MAKSTTTIKFDSAAMRALLSSPEIAGDIEERTSRIAAAAGEGFVARTEVKGGSSKLGRAMGYVTSTTFEARRAEAEDRALTRSIDAGR